MFSPSSNINPCHSLFFDRDPAFAVQYGGHFRSGIAVRDHFWTRTVPSRDPIRVWVGTSWDCLKCDPKNNGVPWDVNSVLVVFFLTTCNIDRKVQLSNSSWADRSLCNFLNVPVLEKWLGYRRRLPKEAGEILVSKQAQTKWRKFFALGTMKMTKWLTLYRLQRPTVKLFPQLLHEIRMVRRLWRNIRHHLYEWRKLFASLSLFSDWWAQFLIHVCIEPKTFIGMSCYSLRDFLSRCSPHWAQTICRYFNYNKPRDRVVNKSKKGNRITFS